jgi:hypothetical protein
VFDQIQCYFTVKKLTRLSALLWGTSTALIQMTNWLREIMGAVLIDFSVAFDIDHSLLLEKMCFGFTPLAILWIELPVPTKHRVI